jgi:hypothetical protein
MYYVGPGLFSSGRKTDFMKTKTARKFLDYLYGNSAGNFLGFVIGLTSADKKTFNRSTTAEIQASLWLAEPIENAELAKGISKEVSWSNLVIRGFLRPP